VWKGSTLYAGALGGDLQAYQMTLALMGRSAGQYLPGNTGIHPGGRTLKGSG